MPPADVAEAMGDAENFDVYVFHKCNAWGGACDFAPAFVAGARARRAQALADARRALDRGAAGDDSCTVHGDCQSCLDDPTSKCGWCDGQVVDTDGNVICGDDGNGCCGGNDQFSTCNQVGARERERETVAP